MKFRIKKETTVLTHREGTSFNVRNFSPLPTDNDVSFDKEDVWFVPGVDSREDAALASVCHDSAAGWFDYMIGNFFGFRLPENKKQIDYIIVPKAEVEMIKSKEDIDSHISESDKALRNVRRQGGGYWLPGQGIPK